MTKNEQAEVERGRNHAESDEIQQIHPRPKAVQDLSNLKATKCAKTLHHTECLNSLQCLKPQALGGNMRTLMRSRRWSIKAARIEHFLREAERAAARCSKLKFETAHC